jgi:aspartate/methionine/tyrosine aminotransferase
VPYWVSYGEQVKLAQGMPIFVTGAQDNDYKITVDQLEAARQDDHKYHLRQSAVHDGRPIRQFPAAHLLCRSFL